MNDQSAMPTKPQILLVDDSAMNRAILAEILGSDYRILEAENGQECMEKLQSRSADIALVLLDIVMPVMDGFEVLEAMNASRVIEDIPVIMEALIYSGETTRAVAPDAPATCGDVSHVV